MDLFEGLIQKKDVEEEKKRISNLLTTIEQKNSIVLKDATVRNLIFVGRTRSGKSTALKVLKNPLHWAESTSLFTGTSEPVLFNFTVENIDENIGQSMNYNISVIDTPGLFEHYENIEEVSENGKITESIATCLQYEITMIHAIFFICSFESGINNQDIESFREVVSLFAGAEDKVIMLITRAERKTTEEKQNLKDQLLRHPQFKSILDLIGGRIFFTGSICQTDYDNGEFDSVVSTLRNVLEMRTKLYEYIFKQTEPCHIQNINYFRANIIRAKELQEKINQLKEQLENKKEKGTVEDLNLSKTKRELSESRSQSVDSSKKENDSRGDSTPKDKKKLKKKAESRHFPKSPLSNDKDSKT